MNEILNQYNVDVAKYAQSTILIANLKLQIVIYNAERKRTTVYNASI